MSSTNNNPGPRPGAALRSVLRPVLRALVVTGWVWLPGGVPPQAFFGNPWPYEPEEPARPVRTDEPVTVTLSRP
jgi:hypothetical protein